jgi:hypothetical protein
MCQIGWTEGPQGPQWTLQLCLIRGHQTFSEWLFKQVHSSPSDSQVMGERWASQSLLTVGGDGSTTVTLTRSSSG